MDKLSCLCLVEVRTVGAIQAGDTSFRDGLELPALFKGPRETLEVLQRLSPATAYHYGTRRSCPYQKNRT